MTTPARIDAFIRDFVRDIQGDSAAVFIGAGMSKSVGFVDWRELLREVASEIGLEVEKEHDLISLAQFHVNDQKSSDKLARTIMREFSEHASPSPSHATLARLPIRTYWTTNYDTLIEDSLRGAQKIADAKHSVEQLNTTRAKRDAVVYKMHGDVYSPNSAVISKAHYECYYDTHAPFITALSGDLVSKTFLFLGFSFTDPNLDYVLSRLHTKTKRTHYCLMREDAGDAGDDDETKDYKTRKQNLHVEDLKRYGIQTLLVKEYDDIPKLLARVEALFLKRTIFISGSAESFGAWDRQEAQQFIHGLSHALVTADYRVVNGFGWGVGSAVINGALEAIYAKPEKYSEDQLVMRPFPQYAADEMALKESWERYRQRMIALSGVAVFVFGNKAINGAIANASGVMREAEIALEQGRIVIPIAATGFAAQTLAEEVRKAPQKYYGDSKWLAKSVEELGLIREPAKIINALLIILKKLETQ